MAATTIYDAATIISPAWWGEQSAAQPVTLRGRLANAYVRTIVGLLRLVPSGDLRSADYDWARFRRVIDATEKIIAFYPREVLRESADLAGTAGEWFATRECRQSPRTLLYVHGGSFVLGRSKLHDVLAANLAKNAEARVLAVDYRLAPEHPFPAGIDDVVASYRALLVSGLDPEQVALVGDSAGAGLALGALIALRDEGVALPAAYVALSPWADLTFSGPSIIENADADPFMSNIEYISVFAELYLQGQPPDAPLASPAIADLSGMPDTLVHVGSTDLLLDDSRRIVEGIRVGGGNARLDVWRDMPHVWQRMKAFVPEAECSLASIGHFLRRRIRV